jgi:hypothetical protein
MRHCSGGRQTGTLHSALAARRLEIFQTFSEGTFDSLDVISPIIRGRSRPRSTDCKSSNGHGRDQRALYRELAHCSPGALVDLWQADASGAYDNKGFRLRGHVFTDVDGRYAFRTIMPGLYPGRTRHYHVKVQAPNKPVLTTQFYFPDEKANRSDEFFHNELVMRVAAADDGLRARFDVVLAMR